MQSCFGFFSITALNKMRALILIFLTCCMYFEFVNGLKSSVKVPAQALPKFQSSNILNDDSKSAILDLRGGATLSESSSVSTGVPLFVVKIFLQLALTSVNMMSWAIPLRNKNLTKNSKLLGLANAFAGGIFLMLAFGHMLPHSVSVLESIGRDRNIAFKFTLVGYLLVLFVEKIAFNSHAIMHEVSESGAHTHSHSHSETAQSLEIRQVPSEEYVKSVLAPSGPVTVVQSSSATVIEADEETKGALSPKSAIVLLMAMSVHSLFETMALGLANDKTSAILMAASIGLHQPAESIALLVAFLKTSMPRAHIMRWLALFSAVGPLGVTTGVLISKIATPLMDGIIVAITAGTFLYVGATEVVSEEFENVEGWEKWRKFGAFLGGMATILMVTSATDRWESSIGGGHDHSHSGAGAGAGAASFHSHSSDL